MQTECPFFDIAPSPGITMGSVNRSSDKLDLAELYRLYNDRSGYNSLMQRLEKFQVFANPDSTTGQLRILIHPVATITAANGWLLDGNRISLFLPIRSKSYNIALFLTLFKQNKDESFYRLIEAPCLEFISKTSYKIVKTGIIEPEVKASSSLLKTDFSQEITEESQEITRVSHESRTKIIMPTSLLNIKFSIEEIYDLYNHYPGLLERQVIKVTPVNNVSPVTFERSDTGNYWLLELSPDHIFLFPRPGLRFNQYQLGSFEKSFECQGERIENGGGFKLLATAKLEQSSRPNNWLLKSKGQITFNVNVSQFSVLEAKIQSLQVENIELSDDLENLKQQRTKLKNQIHTKEQEVSKLEENLKKVKDSYEKGWEQSLAEQKLNNAQLQRLILSLDQAQNQIIGLEKQVSLWENEYKLLQKDIENLIPSWQQVESFAKQLADIQEKERSKLQRLVSKNFVPPAISTLESSISIQRNPRPLEQQQNGIGVSETRESFEKRWAGLVAPIVLETASNYNFLIINDRELIPKPGSKVTETKLNTIDGLFEYQNFRSGAPFQVIQPAIVTAMEGDRWQVTQKGKLNFLN